MSHQSPPLNASSDLCTQASKRVHDALGEASKARAESERAASESAEQLERAFVNNDPARLIARGLLVQPARTTSRLRNATARLEEHAAAAAATHAADVRSLLARHAAHADALRACLLSEMHHMEIDDHLSIDNLRDEVTRLEVARARDISERDAEIARWKDELHTTRAALAAERQGRDDDNHASAASSAALREQLDDLMRELERARRAALAEKNTLASMLAAESADKEQRLAEGDGARIALESDYEATLEDLRGRLALQRSESQQTTDALSMQLASLEEERRATEARLREELRALSASSEAAEERHRERAREVAADHRIEMTLLKSRVDKLTRLHDAANDVKTGAKARAVLFTEKVKAQALHARKAREEQAAALAANGEPGQGKEEQEQPQARDASGQHDALAPPPPAMLHLVSAALSPHGA